MSKRTYTGGMTGLVLLAVVAAGCLVSGTFVVTEKFSFTLQSGLYFYSVDVTDEPEWQDHKDDIDKIDAVGLEFWITSHAPGTVRFDAWVDEFSGEQNPSTVPSGSYRIIDGLEVHPGQTHFTYGQSLRYLQNIDKVKSLLRDGRLDFYGQVGGADGSQFLIDSAKVVVTVSASR